MKEQEHCHLISGIIGFILLHTPEPFWMTWFKRKISGKKNDPKTS